MKDRLIAFLKNERSISVAAILIIFLALIRCISEFFRLDSIKGSELTIDQVKPFLIGALVCAVSLLIMFMCYLLNKYKVVTLLMAITIAVMLCVKFKFGIN